MMKAKAANGSRPGRCGSTPGAHRANRRRWRGWGGEAASGLLLVLLFLLLSAPSVHGQAGAAESREVTFPGHQLQLTGTLLTPKAPRGARQPAAVIVGEYGISTRDGVGAGSITHPIYRQLAESLAAQGVVTLRFDPRCRGGSECRPVAAYDDYIDDLHGAVKFLAARPEVDPQRLVLIGHGEGGYMATSLLAQQDNVATGLIVAAMSGRTLGKMLRDEFQARMTEEARPAEEISAMLNKVERITRALFYSRAEVLNEKFDPRNPYDARLEVLLRETPRTVSLLVNDPLQAFAAVRVPVLILQGEKDVEVTMKDASFLEEALKRIYHPDFTRQNFPEMDHLLLVSPGKPAFAASQQPGRPLDPGFLRAVNGWMETRFVRPAGATKKK